MEQSQQKRTGLIVAILVILGLTAGAVVGLLLGWVVWPVQYTDTAIADLATEYKDEYIVLVAAAYTTDGDLEKAQARLARLEVPNINQSLSALIDRYILEGQDESEIRALVALANAQGVLSPNMVAYVATNTPIPTDTPLPTPTPLPTDTPTVTPVPPTSTPVPPTETPTPPPTDTPVPTAVPPTNTPAPPTNTPVPQATNTPKPPSTNTPKPQPTAPPQPTNPPAAQWSIIEQRLLGPGEAGQRCDGGDLRIGVTAVDANGAQLGGVWIFDRYSNQYQVTGNVNSPDWGPGQTKFEYGIGGGGSLCVASGEGAGCVGNYTRDMPCYAIPPIEDLHAAGYCDQCCEIGASVERCRQLVAEGKCMGYGHYSWRVVFKRSW
ncbi:MAG: hypothetical protein PVI80_08710 [Anaerolineae bacterium]|jgi:hypothetical protein